MTYTQAQLSALFAAISDIAVVFSSNYDEHFTAQGLSYGFMGANEQVYVFECSCISYVQATYWAGRTHYSVTRYAPEEQADLECPEYVYHSYTV